MNKISPVLLFVYNRYLHTKRTIDALKKNTLAKSTDLIIFSDAAKSNSNIQDVNTVREYIKTVSGFKSISIIERATNIGLANSIISGVSEHISKYGRVIVLEDDLITSTHFLSYMNECLDLYENNRKILSITGYNIPSELLRIPITYKYDVYGNYRTCSWSWATWENRWENVDWNLTGYDSEENKKILKRYLNKAGNDLYNMLQSQIQGSINSWSIRFSLHSCKYDYVNIYPVTSLINNIGHDGTGVHCKTEKKTVFSHNQMNTKSFFDLPEDIDVNRRIQRLFNKAYNISLLYILKTKIFEILFKKKRS